MTKRRAHNSTLPASEKPLRRKSAMPKPSKPMAKRGKKARSRWQEAFGEKSVWVRSLGCAVGAGCMGRVECAHTRSRAAGGTSADTVPLCTLHHAEQHQTGILTFQARYGIDLYALAERLERLWQAMQARAA